MVRILQRKPCPGEHNEGNSQNGVLHPLKPKCAQRLLAGLTFLLRVGIKPHSPDLVQPITEIVQEHEPDRNWDDEQVDGSHPAQRRRFTAPRGDVNLPQRKSLSGAGVTLATGFGQVGGVDCRFRVGRGADVVDTVTAGAVRNCFGAGLGRQAVERSVKAHDAIGRKPKPPGKAHVIMARRAGVANMRWMDRRSRIRRRQD